MVGRGRPSAERRGRGHAADASHHHDHDGPGRLHRGQHRRDRPRPDRVQRADSADEIGIDDPRSPSRAAPVGGDPSFSGGHRSTVPTLVLGAAARPQSPSPGTSLRARHPDRRRFDIDAAPVARGRAQARTCGVAHTGTSRQDLFDEAEARSRGQPTVLAKTFSPTGSTARLPAASASATAASFVSASAPSWPFEAASAGWSPAGRSA
jgi:hypothetical protein